MHEGISRPLQVVLKTRELPVQFEDLSRWMKRRKRKHIAQWEATDRARGFNVSRDPLMRLGILRTEPRCVPDRMEQPSYPDGWLVLADSDAGMDGVVPFRVYRHAYEVGGNDTLPRLDRLVGRAREGRGAGVLASVSGRVRYASGIAAATCN